MADTLPEVVSAWELAFRASHEAVAEKVDAPRFREAFKRVYPTLREWPAPADFLAALPPRPQRALLKELPPVSAEEREANLLRIRDLLASLSGPKAVSDNIHNERVRAAGNEREKV